MTGPDVSGSPALLCFAGSAACFRPGAASHHTGLRATVERSTLVIRPSADDLELSIAYNPMSKPQTNMMRRPSVIAGIAYVQLLTAVHILKAFDSPYINRVPLYIGSPLSVHAQWTYMASLLPVAVVVGVGLVLGKAWVRWILAATILATAAFTIPVQNAQGIYLYVLALLIGSTILALLFLAPSARTYFAHPRAAKRSLSVRDLFARAMFAFCAVNTSFILADRFAGKVELSTTIAVLAILSLPALVLGIVARWDITTACRDAATVLLSTALFLACRLLLVAAYVHVSNPTAFPVAMRIDSVILTSVIAVLGLLLSRLSVHRASRPQPLTASES